MARYDILKTLDTEFASLLKTVDGLTGVLGGVFGEQREYHVF